MEQQSTIKENEKENGWNISLPIRSDIILKVWYLEDVMYIKLVMVEFPL